MLQALLDMAMSGHLANALTFIADVVTWEGK